MQEPWMDDFVSSFKSPSAKPDFIKQVQRNLRQALQEKEIETVEAGNLQRTTWFIIAIIVATIPIFLTVNYMYYVFLQNILQYLLPQLMNFFILLFLLSVTFMAAICYGAIPICAAYWMRDSVLYNKHGRLIKR